MAVEVKHYKAAAKGKFIFVFEDYARALPLAQVYLVNHGPTGNAVYEVSGAAQQRCHSIARLMPSFREAREELARAVRQCVGEPIASRSESDGHSDTDRVVVVDVSSSMRSMIRTPAGKKFIRELAAQEEPRSLVAVDTSILGHWPPTEDGLAAVLACGGGSTALGDAVRDLMRSTRHVVIVTDAEGVATLEGVNLRVHEAQSSAPNEFLVRLCVRDGRDDPDSGGSMHLATDGKTVVNRQGRAIFRD
jgi:hypothetical protein